MSVKLFSTKEKQTEVINLYLNQKLSSRQIAQIYNCEKTCILDLLKKHNIQSRPAYKLPEFTVNDNYFDNITTQEQAYFLGLLYADGTNNNHIDKPNYGTIAIGLQECDKPLLETCNKLIQNTRPLLFVNKTKENIKWKNQYQLKIFSQHMSNTLANKWGCISNKTYSLTFPEKLPSEFYNSFIRGVFDGDGMLYIPSHLQHTTFWFEIVGTEMLLNSIKNIFENTLNLYMPPSCFQQARNADPVIKRLRVTGRDNLTNLLNWLYKDSTIRMERKYLKYLEMLSIYETNPRQRYRRNPNQLAMATQ